jgi:hypothetical protein
VSEAKDLMKSFGNNQWDDKYPATEHFKEDTLIVVGRQQ